MQMRGDLKLRA